MDRVAPVLVVVLLLAAGGCLEGQVLQDGAGGTAGASATPTAGELPDIGDTPDGFETPAGNGTLRVHYLDVGQADATLVEFPNGETLLVDSGDWRQDGQDVLAALAERDVERVDHLVATHPHADHIGGHEAVIDHVETDGEGIGAAYDSGVAHTSGTFDEYLDAVERHDVDLYTVRAGDELAVGDASVTFVNPPADRDTDDRHPNSVSLVVTYGDTEFLFTGDLEGAGERRLVANYSATIDADVYQAGHHGSRTSSSPAFLDAADPAVVVVSSALDSQYDHPHDETLAAFDERGCETYWTAVHGTVTIETDGATLSVVTERDAPTDAGDLGEAKPDETATPSLDPVGFSTGSAIDGTP